MSSSVSSSPHLFNLFLSVFLLPSFRDAYRPHDPGALERQRRDAAPHRIQAVRREKERGRKETRRKEKREKSSVLPHTSTMVSHIRRQIRKGVSPHSPALLPPLASLASLSYSTGSPIAAALSMYTNRLQILPLLPLLPPSSFLLPPSPQVLHRSYHGRVARPLHQTLPQPDTFLGVPREPQLYRPLPPLRDGRVRRTEHLI